MEGLDKGKGREAALRFPPSLATRHSPLPFLIANEPHSREKSSSCKQSICEMLIANEFQLQNTPRTLPGTSDLNSNRHTPRLEINLSRRKQRIGPLSNRHKFAFFNSDTRLLNRMSETPSRKSKLLDFELNCRKQRASHFLIDSFRALFDARHTLSSLFFASQVSLTRFFDWHRFRSTMTKQSCKQTGHRARFLALAAIFSLSATLVYAQSGPAPAPGALELTSQLGRKLYALPVDDALIAARKKLAADPKNAALFLALSQAEAGHRQYREAVATCTKGLEIAPNNADLYIERGHRELGLREFALAQRDLEHAVSIDPKKLDAFYHLGLAHYFQGHFSAAADSFQKALALAQSNDSVIDCSNWLYVSLRRAGKEKEAVQALTRITPEMKNTEPHLFFYLQLLRFYQGAKTEKDVLPPKPADPNDTEAELSFDTVTYGVGNWHLYNHEPARAMELFEQVVTGNAWNAWGFVGAETELARMEKSHGNKEPKRPGL
jgi:tetratricopeptide (TPR) repeat protein